MRRIVIVGGGYAGFYTARNLQTKLKRYEAEVMVIDPRPYMTYQPFLPEVLAGSIEPRHALVSFRKNLRNTEVISGAVMEINHSTKSVTVRPTVGGDYALKYDILVVTAGAVTKMFPVEGAQQEAIGLKNVEEAIAVRDSLLTAFDKAASLPPGHARKRLLSVTFVGGGFAGIEGFGELLSLATSLLRYYPELTSGDLDFRLVEASNRVLPEVSNQTAEWVVRLLEQGGAHFYLGSRVQSVHDGHVTLSTGIEFDTNLIVWTTGNAANPVIAEQTDLPVDSRGFLLVRADLRVGTTENVLADVWGAGDNASVPDLSGESQTGRVVPNAQNAVRQGKLLAANIAASIRGKATKNYIHKSLGVIATLGIGQGVFQLGPVAIKGFAAWLIHRGYHVFAVPTWDRKVRVLVVWITGAFFGRDIISLQDAQHPRAAFVKGGRPRESGVAAPYSVDKPSMERESVETLSLH